MESYRAHSSVVWGWTAIVIGVIIAVVHVTSVGFAYAHGGLGLGAALICVGVAVFLRPHVAVSSDHVEIHNVTQTARVPFARLADLNTRWTLEAVGDDGLKVGAFAAPAPGAAASRRAPSEQEMEAAAAGGPTSGTLGDRLGTPSGDAAATVRAAWEDWRAANPVTAGATSSGPSITRRPDWTGIALMVAAGLAATWGLFF